MINRKVLLVLFLCGMSTLLACGKKSSPHSPEELAPVAVRFFVARGSLGGVTLTRTYGDVKQTHG